MKTTKGPWSWDKLDGPNCKYAYLESAKECILEVTEETYLNNENLNLIAATPDLLEALNNILALSVSENLNQKELLDDIASTAYIALKKAKGES